MLRVLVILLAAVFIFTGVAWWGVWQAIAAIVIGIALGAFALTKKNL